MARGKARVFEPVSTPLQDLISVDYTVVGTKAWFDQAFEPDSLLPEECYLVENPEIDLVPIREALWKERILGADTETTGPIVKGDKGYSMNPVNEDTRVVLLQLGTEDKVWLIEPSLIPHFKDILESDRILHLLHHALYDFKFLLVKYGIHLVRIYCSMLSEQAITAGKMGMKVGLADCFRRYPDYGLISKAVRSQFVQLNNGRMNREMVYYAARDIPILFPVFREQVKDLKRLKLEDTAKLEFDVIACTAEMEVKGVYLDIPKLSFLIKYWLQRQVEMEKEILQLYDAEVKKNGNSSNFIIPELMDVFDLGSNAQKIAALRSLGFELDDVKRSTLLTLNDPIARMLGEYSNVTKWTSTYGENMMQKINAFSGRWHPRFAQMGSGVNEGDSGRDNKETTATGRYVSDAQQFPRKADRYWKEEDPEIKAEVCSHFAQEISRAESDFYLEKAVA
jgi:DNA polymerase I-like protein with 3'-5' exonuclease and polymerase domains